MQETPKNELPRQPDGWVTKEYNVHDDLVWFSFTQFRPTEISWIRDLPNKKHYLVIAPFYIDESQAEKITGVKSYREATKRLVDAFNGL